MIRVGEVLTPEAFVSAIRVSIANSTYVFKNGRCYELFLLLRTFFKDAEPWYDPIAGHVYTKVGESWYDIDGKHDVLPSRSHVMDKFYIKKAHRWGKGLLRPKERIEWHEMKFPPINLLSAPRLAKEKV